MEFTLPTTLDEMYQTLSQIFDHYRVRKEGFEEIMLQDLVLERLDIQQLSDQDLLTKAEKILEAEHEREKKNYQTELSSKTLAIQEKIALLEKSSQEEITNITTLYDQSIEKMQNQALKSGLMNSSIVVDKTALLEDSKNQKIAELTWQKNDKIASLTAEKEQLNAKILASDEYFDEIHQKEIYKKFIELCDEREKRRIEVFKYNNSLDEKEQRYANSIKETKSSLYLRFLDIKSGEYTKDQLVEMGYFEDVVTCVCAYLDTLEPIEAYQIFLAEQKLIMYLDYYYEQVGLLYKFKATA